MSPLDAFIVPIPIEKLDDDVYKELLRLAGDQAKQADYIASHVQRIAPPPSDNDPAVKTVYDKSGKPILQKGAIQTIKIPVPTSPTQMGIILYSQSILLDKDKERVEQMVKENKRIVGFGPFEKEVCWEALEWYIKFGKPLFFSAMVHIERIPKDKMIIFTGFSGSEDDAKRMMEWNPSCMFCIDGRITHESSDLARLIRNKIVPLENILTESRSPHIVPKEWADSDTISTPHMTGSVVESINALTGDEVSSVLRQNFYRAFGF